MPDRRRAARAHRPDRPRCVVTQYRGPSHGRNPEKFTQHDIYATQYRACERLAAGNVEPDTRANRRCAGSVDRFVSGERLIDPVVWVNVAFHHVVRDEDEDPMPVHWQGFSIAPRDVTATNPY